MYGADAAVTKVAVTLVVPPAESVVLVPIAKVPWTKLAPVPLPIMIPVEVVVVPALVVVVVVDESDLKPSEPPQLANRNAVTRPNT